MRGDEKSPAAGLAPPPPGRWTKQELVPALRAAGIAPRRSRGQNFLLDPNALEFIARTAGLGRGDAALEIGCGPGSLTAYLAREAGRVWAVDIDGALLELARRRLSADNVTFLQKDILAGRDRLNPEVVAAVGRDLATSGFPRLRVVSNLPYGIASPLILDLLESSWPLQDLLVMVQLEVAERLAAVPGTRPFGYLTILTQTLADVAVVRRFKPSVFWPPPEVTSALVRLIPRPPAARPAPATWTLLKPLVRDMFSYRRKVLARAFEHAKPFGIGTDRWLAAAAELGIPPAARTDTLTPAQWTALAEFACRETGGA